MLAARRLETLATASRIFAEAASDRETAFERIARHVAETLRDLCSIRLLSSDRTRFEPPAGIWDTDPELRELLRGTPSVAASEGIGPEVMETGQSIVMSDLDPS